AATAPSGESASAGAVPAAIARPQATARAAAARRGRLRPVQRLPASAGGSDVGGRATRSLRTPGGEVGENLESVHPPVGRDQPSEEERFAPDRLEARPQKRQGAAPGWAAVPVSGSRARPGTARSAPRAGAASPLR